MFLESFRERPRQESLRLSDVLYSSEQLRILVGKSFDPEQMPYYLAEIKKATDELRSRLGITEDLDPKEVKISYNAEEDKFTAELKSN